MSAFGEGFASAAAMRADRRYPQRRRVVTLTSTDPASPEPSGALGRIGMRAAARDSRAQVAISRGIGRSGATRQIVMRKLKSAECRETPFTDTERHIRIMPLAPGSVPRMLALAIRSYGLRPPVGARWSAA